MTNTQTPLYVQNARYGAYPFTYKTVEVWQGGLYTLHELRNGTEIMTDDGPAVIMASYGRNSLVRFHESQECRMVLNDFSVTALSYGGWGHGIPKIGEFVEVRKGEHQGRVGLVFQEGLNATYVVFPGDRDRKHKFSARDLIILPDAQITT